MSHTLSRKYATPLRLELGRSRLLWRYLTLLHGTTLVILPFMQLPGSFALLLALVLLFSYLRYRRRYWLPDNLDTVRSLLWGSDRRMQLGLGSGQRTGATLLPHGFVLSWLVILQLRLDTGGKRHLIVLPDMLDAESFRRLRVRLLLENGKWGHSAFFVIRNYRSNKQ
jgi:hypothetical protein